MNGRINFQRDWHHYKYGFGTLHEEFWLGLQKIYALTATKMHKIHIYMVYNETSTAWTANDGFMIGPEVEDYRLLYLGTNTGTLNYDTLACQAGQPFSTMERDNGVQNCSTGFEGAWWFANCHDMLVSSHLSHFLI